MANNVVETNEGEIFSSDGLPPLPRPTAPVTSLSSTKGDNVVLDTGKNVDLVQAFEVFSGKLFFPPSSSSKPVPSSGPIGTATSIVETPLQRLARLRMEVSELEQDLKDSYSSSSTLMDSNLAHPLGSDVLQDLASRLAAISTNVGNTSSPKSVQSDLTALVSLELQKLQKKNENIEDSSSEKKGITYELYPANVVVENESGAGGSGTSLETRMGKIEKMLGVVGSSSFANTSVLERLKQVEDMAKSVDLNTLDAAAARAKLIRTDLEAVAKHRSKLPLPPEDSKTITQLYDQMQSLSTLSKELPTVITRLTDLAHLHTHASDFATRLVAVENSVTDVERLLGNFESVLDRVEEGCVENAKVVEENMKLLDERMEALRK